MTASPRSPRHADTRGILDTNTVILLDRLGDASVLPEHPEITTITLAELSVGPLVTDDPRERAVRQAHLQLAEASFRALPFDAAAARRFGWVAANLRHTGRKPAARAYDALIAAVALANDLPLYTVNPADFQGIDGLTIRAIPHPDARPTDVILRLGTRSNVSAPSVEERRWSDEEIADMFDGPVFPT